MDCLDVFYDTRQYWPEYEAVMSDLPYLFATGSRVEALAMVHAQRSYVMNHHGRRQPGRSETGAMVGSVTTMAEALDLCEHQAPRVLISTDQLEDGDGLELVRQANRRWPEMPILLLMKSVSLPRLRQALLSGSRGIITDALVGEGNVYVALQTVLTGGRYLDPNLCQLLEENEMGWDPRLSEKQLQILQAVVQGLSDRQIAQALDLPYDTVRYHLKQAYRELGTTNRNHAALLLVQQGLLKPPTLPRKAWKPAPLLEEESSEG